MLQWFLKILAMKSILDLKNTHDARERWTFHVANSMFQEYLWYYRACNLEDWNYTDDIDLRKFGHNVNRAQFYSRLIHPLVIFDTKCIKCRFW